MDTHDMCVPEPQTEESVFKIKTLGMVLNHVSLREMDYQYQIAALHGVFISIMLDRPDEAAGYNLSR